MQSARSQKVNRGLQKTWTDVAVAALCVHAVPKGLRLDSPRQQRPKHSFWAVRRQGLVGCYKRRNFDSEPLRRCRDENSRNRKEAKRSRRFYERRDSPFDDNSDIDEIESEPLIVVYPEIDDRHPAFVAVELDQRGYENCRIFHRGKETALWSCHFPPRMCTIRGLGEDLQDCEFKNHLWRHCHAAKGRDATARGAIVVHDAVDAAASLQQLMRDLVEGSKAEERHCPIIKVDPIGGCVCLCRDNCCIIFSVGGEDPVRFVTLSGLPAVFIDLKLAQFIANPVNNFRNNCLYVWEPPQGSNGPCLVFGLSRSTSYWHEDYGDLGGDAAMFVAYVQVHENDPSFLAVELNPEEWYAPRRFLQGFFVTI